MDKVLQGYYDRSGIGNDSFDNAIRVSGEGVELSDDMNARGIRLEKKYCLALTTWVLTCSTRAWRYRQQRRT